MMHDGREELPSPPLPPPQSLRRSYGGNGPGHRGVPARRHLVARTASLCVRIGFKKRTKMAVGIINTNTVVHERPECATRPHAANTLDPLCLW